MVPIIPKQRQNTTAIHRPFSDLVRYLIVQKVRENEVKHGFEVMPGIDDAFSNLIDYSTASLDPLTKEDKCIAVRIHGVTSLETAILEMNAVAEQNKRSPEPAFHFILSWPEFERPEPEAIFDAAVHAIKSLGLGQHQYVIAVHDNTDNRHCHIAVNRINPVTFKSQHLEWSKLSLHKAARESEIKHDWFHDNGAFIVQLGPNGEKEIVTNPDHEDFEVGQENDGALPSWHDPGSLESWLKGYVGSHLKRSLRDLQSWQGLHAWLDRYGVTLKDTGGGGLRLVATSYVTGEVLELAASKGLRLLKRPDLEKRWGPYHDPVIHKPVVPDLSQFSPEALQQGVNDVLDAPNRIDGTLDYLIHRPEHRRKIEAERRRGLLAMSDGDVAAGRTESEVLLPDALHLHLGDREAREDQDLRRPGLGRNVREGLGSQSTRELRKAERAAAREDLRKRYALYRKVLQDGAGEYFDHLRTLRKENSDQVKEINKASRDSKRNVRKSALSPAEKLIAVAAIDLETGKKRAALEARFNNRRLEHKATRPPALGWREWLNEQANLGDQAAVSALRGIVYQAGRDAKKAGQVLDDDFDEERASKDAAYRAEQHRKTLARLLEQERQEVAIRSARASTMRPYEMDALLVRYAGIHWHVTGNGNIEYSDNNNHRLFTDRGSRITFDRAIVTDDEIRLALLHAQQKFGRHITLSGQDPVFTARMARHADDLGLVVLNPELEPVIEQHRKKRLSGLAEQRPEIQPGETTRPTDFGLEEVPQTTVEDQLRQKVLSVDPKATFGTPEVEHQTYTGPIIASHDEEGQPLFAQHIGRSHYILHRAVAPQHLAGSSVSVSYQNKAIQIAIEHTDKGKDR